MKIFKKNIELLALVDKAVVYFREGRYDLALDMLANMGDGITALAERIYGDREYFANVSTDSVAEMIEGILAARRDRDYVLLADLLDVQLGSFICNVQELIMKQEDYFAFDEKRYSQAILKLDSKLAESLTSVCGFEADDDEKERLRVNHSALLKDSLDPARLLEQGYAVELTSSGFMTLAASDPEGKKLYLHSNGHVTLESFLLAKRWFTEGAGVYIIYGLGMGYHLSELVKLSPQSEFIVFESDINIMKLFCAFSGEEELLGKDNVSFVYDPEFVFLDRELSRFTGTEKFCIHFPSFKRISNSDAKKLMSIYIPWYNKVKEL
ncbi:MAG: hypothetical protein ILP10_01795 [Lachnospiraceae bacterium]|nr:hypothetical protein [Lachnospiraceae bacterium]